MKDIREEKQEERLKAYWGKEAGRLNCEVPSE
jgi:hypothetical protein